MLFSVRSRAHTRSPLPLLSCTSFPSVLRRCPSPLPQEHVFQFWDQCSDEERRHLLSQLGAMDIDLVNQVRALHV